jgi:hypothetical protein
VAENRARFPGRAEPWEGPLKDEPCAIVGYGPSLKDTWPELKRFKSIFTCSGAYKFLNERGIIAPYHCETDPQSHKVRNLGVPHKSTTFYMGSHCDPNYFDLLEMYEANVKLFNITVGHYTVMLARFLGWYDFHLFGFDHSIPKGHEGTHAGKHEGFKHGVNAREVEGHPDLLTTGNWQGHIQSFFLVTDGIEEIRTTFYGDGLMQRVAKTRVRENRRRVPIAIIGG